MKLKMLNSLEGDSAFTLPPHIDGGGVERWKDDNYRKVYRWDIWKL